jgi:hypothetical protein
MPKIALWFLGGLLALFVLLQLFSLPVLAQQTNPPVVQEPNWDSQRTRDLAYYACFDCHSNQTYWPWYSKVAPVSFFITDHVVEGREHVNFSEWNQYAEEAEEMEEMIRSGAMPLPNYLPLHPEAQLTDAEKEELINGLYATLGGTPGGEEGTGIEGGEEEEHEEEEEEHE